MGSRAALPGRRPLLAPAGAFPRPPVAPVRWAGGGKCVAGYRRPRPPRTPDRTRWSNDTGVSVFAFPEASVFAFPEASVFVFPEASVLREAPVLRFAATVYAAAMRTAAAERSVPNTALPSRRTRLVFVEPSFSSKRASDTGPA